MKRYITVLFSALFIGLVHSFAQEYIGEKEIKHGIWNDKLVEYLSEEILIGLKKTTPYTEFQKIVSENNLSIKEFHLKENWALLETANDVDIFPLIQKIKEYSIIEYVEPNFIGRLISAPSDSLFLNQWYLYNYGQNPPSGQSGADIAVLNAWSITQGSTDIIISVLDSGIPMINNALSHPELNDTSKIILGRSFTFEGDSLKDTKGHGTRVTGIIAAKTNNFTGISGIANGCKVLVVKVSPAGSPTTTAMLRNGMDFAADNGAKIVNISQKVPASNTVENGIDDNDQVLFVAGVGNNGSSVSHPAAYSSSYDNVIAVSATDHNDEFASIYSNYGPEVNVCAPGGHGKLLDPTDHLYPPGPDDIFSTAPNYSYGGNIDYVYDWGTSYSTPIVSAIAGLMLSKNPNLTPLELKKTIEHTSIDLGDEGRDDYYGYGRVNAYNALLAVVGPRNFRRTSPSIGFVVLEWDPILPTSPTNILQYYEISRNINNWGWSVITTTTNTSYTDSEFEKDKEGVDFAQYRIRSKTIDNLYSLYSDIIYVDGTSYWQQKTSEPVKILPENYKLEHNYPNPFNPSTIISYSIPEPTIVTLQIFNSIGQRVGKYLNTHSSAGLYSVQWNAKHLSSGIYFVKMHSINYTSTMKMILKK